MSNIVGGLWSPTERSFGSFKAVEPLCALLRSLARHYHSF